MDFKLSFLQTGEVDCGKTNHNAQFETVPKNLPASKAKLELAARLKKNNGLVEGDLTLSNVGPGKALVTVGLGNMGSYMIPLAEKSSVTLHTTWRLDYPTPLPPGTYAFSVRLRGTGGMIPNQYNPRLWIGEVHSNETTLTLP